MEKKRILLITQEMKPYLIINEAAKIVRNLAGQIHSSGYEIRTLMPRFGMINERRHRLHEVVRLSGINIIIDEDDYPLIIKVASLPDVRMQVYFLDNEDFFKRKHVFGNEKTPFFKDNTERMVFFCKGVLETVKKFGWAPDIVHCHGWMTSLIPMYLKTAYKNDPVFENSKSIYSVYENSFNQELGNDFATKAKISRVELDELNVFGKGSNTDLFKGAVSYADAVIVGDGNIDPDVQAAIDAKKDMPVLAYDEHHIEDLTPYTDFYATLLEE